MDSDLRKYAATLSEAIERSQPGSVRAEALTSARRFVNGALQVIERLAAGGYPLGTVVMTLRLRDLSRTEQTWARELLDSGGLGDAQVTVELYWAKLAALEAASLVVVGVIGSDREDDPEHGVWWGQRVGALLVELAVLGPQFMALPDEPRVRLDD